ncbi:MAG: hypothetical protein ACK47B_22540 [Armatimonadota bacterium]
MLLTSRLMLPVSLLALTLAASGCAPAPPTVIERGAVSPPPAETPPELSASLRPPPEETLRQEMSKWQALDREWQARQRESAAQGAASAPAAEPLAPPPRMTLAPSGPAPLSGGAPIPASAPGPACPLAQVAYAPPEMVERVLSAIGRPLPGGDGDWRDYGLPDGVRVSVGYFGGRALAFSVQLPPQSGTLDPESCLYAGLGIRAAALTRTESAPDRQAWTGVLDRLTLRSARAVKQGDRYSLAQASLELPGAAPVSPSQPPARPPSGPTGNQAPPGVAAVQCQGVTREGRRCRRTTTSPIGLCYQHGG